DDLITDEEAIEKYKEYKESFNKRYIEEFFEAHKNEEWLREKYHPDYVDIQREQVARNIRHRLDVFLDLFDKGMIDNQAVQMDNSDQLIKLMDAVVIKLSGGTDEDLAVLDHMDKDSGDEVLSFQEPERSPEPKTCSAEKSGAKSEEGEEDSDFDSDDGEERKLKQDLQKAKDLLASKDASTKVHEPEQLSASQEWVGVSDNENEASDANKSSGSPVAGSPKDVKPKLEDKPEPTLDSEHTEDLKPEETEVKEEKPENQLNTESMEAFATTEDDDDLCSSQPGFLRLAIYDPMPERSFTRHAWATYTPDVNIKKICWALNTSPLLRDKWQSSSRSSGELCATVNRELAQRVRPVTPITRHKPVMRNDLLLASLASGAANENHSGAAGDEGTAESADTITAVPIETDSSLARALDRLLIYLRIVYSVDYYSATVYQFEDSMPHRCGIFHARGDRGLTGGSQTRGHGFTVTPREVTEYIQTFSAKMKPLLESPPDLTDEEIAALGARDPDKAAEDFIEANIQKRTSKKKPFKVVWVCPLSDKKFREPIFVRKHILNKHMEKVEAARKDNVSRQL
ncbi:unnamed protein product, partial [Dibothriocephalus latus]